MQSLTKTNVLFRFKKGWPQLFLNWVSCWKLTRKNVLCWGNCCQFGEQFLTDRIFWAIFPKHSQNRCFIPSLHKITTAVHCEPLKWTRVVISDTPSPPLFIWIKGTQISAWLTPGLFTYFITRRYNLGFTVYTCVISPWESTDVKTKLFHSVQQFTDLTTRWNNYCR